MGTRQELFINSIRSGALQLWNKFGILPSVAIGQAILESGWGSSSLAIKYNNLFGIKGSYQGMSAMLNTWEVYNGKRYEIKDGFRVYPDWETSILDYGVFLTVNKRYAQALNVQSYKEQIKRIHSAGYATDPDYATKVISIIESYRLQEFDKQVLGQKTPPPPPPPTRRDPIVPYPGYYIRLGSRGKDVERVQRAVKVTPDGIFGKVTEQAVREYQKRHGLAPDGIVGVLTWNTMF